MLSPLGALGANLQDLRTRAAGRAWIYCYRKQQERGFQRKLFLIRLRGGGCQRCGCQRNYAAMAFHHRDPSQKSFELDLRAISNRTWLRVLHEAAKCELLCSNCHLEVHHPQCAVTAEAIGAALTLPHQQRRRRS